jgi:hypothetical protein
MATELRVRHMGKDACLVNQTAAKTEQVGGSRPIGEASVVMTYVSETIGR